MSSQISTNEPGILKTEWSLLREEGINCFAPRRLGGDVVDDLCIICVVQTTLGLPQTPIVSLSIHRTNHYGRCHTYFIKSSDVVIFQALLGILTELFITRKFFTKLRLAHMPKINYLGSDTQSLNQHHQLLSCDEPFYFLVFPQIVILMAMVVAEILHN